MIALGNKQNHKKLMVIGWHPVEEAQAIVDAALAVGKHEHILKVND